MAPVAWIVSALCILAVMACAEAASVKVCLNDFLDIHDLEICPFGQTVSITAAFLGQSAVPATGQDLCPSDAVDCRVDVVAERPVTLDQLRAQCERKIICDTFLVEGDQIPCQGGNVNPDYLYFEYECVAVSGQFKYAATCSGQGVTDVQCPDDFELRVRQTLFADTGTGGCESHDSTDYQCVANVTVWAPDYYDTILSACDGQQACTGLLAVEGDVDVCGNLTDVTTNNLVIGFDCIPVIKTNHACVGQLFDGVTCSPGFGIDVMSAYFGDEQGTLTLLECQNLAHMNTCLIDIATREPRYMDEILDKCEGKEQCEGLEAKEGPIGQCFPNMRNDYVRIYYQCMALEQTTTTGATDSTTTGDTTTAATSTEPPSTSTVVTTGAATDSVSTQSTVAQSSTGAQTTAAQSTDSQTTVVQSTNAQTTIAQTTNAQTTNVQTTNAQTTSRLAVSTVAGDTTTVPPLTTDSATDTPASDLSQTETYIIIGAILGLIPLIGIILCICYYCRRPTSMQPTSMQPTTQDARYYDPYFYPQKQPVSATIRVDGFRY